MATDHKNPSSLSSVFGWWRCFCKAPLLYPVHRPKPLATAASSEDATEVTKQTLTGEPCEPIGSSEGCEKRWLMVTNFQTCLAKPSFMYANYFKNIIFSIFSIFIDNKDTENCNCNVSMWRSPTEPSRDSQHSGGQYVLLRIFSVMLPAYSWNGAVNISISLNTCFKQFWQRGFRSDTALSASVSERLGTGFYGGQRGGDLTSEAPCREPLSEGHRHPSCRGNKNNREQG